MRIIAYTFEADVHCLPCTFQRFGHSGAKGFCVEHNSNPASKSRGKSGVYTSYFNGDEVALDENLIPTDQADREGNPIHPVFSTDEHKFTHCGDCHEEL